MWSNCRETIEYTRSYNILSGIEAALVPAYLVVHNYKYKVKLTIVKQTRVGFLLL